MLFGSFWNDAQCYFYCVIKKNVIDPERPSVTNLSRGVKKKDEGKKISYERRDNEVVADALQSKTI